MAFEAVTQLVRSLAGDGSRSRQLREDPVGLAASHGLGPPGVAALTDVDRFFETEKPILQASVRPRAVNVPPLTFIPAQLAAKSTLVASSDTGTLLPGPNTGSFSATGTVSHTVLAPAPAAPAGPSAPAGPAPFAPGGPVAPGGPGPWGPIPPAGPIPIGPAPQAPFQGPSPSGPTGPAPYGWGGPGAAWPPGAGACAGCACESAIVAISALVAATSQTSLTAIAAIAAQSRRSHG